MLSDNINISYSLDLVYLGMKYTSHHEKYPLSVAERRIFSTLIKHKVKFQREVEFEALPKYRFDFYLYQDKIVIEYDGKHHKENDQVKINDKIKTSFCLGNNIRIYRIDRENYNNIEQVVTQIIKTKTSKKPKAQPTKSQLVLESEGWIFRKCKNNAFEAKHPRKGIRYNYNKSTLLFNISQL